MYILIEKFTFSLFDDDCHLFVDIRKLSCIGSKNTEHDSRMCRTGVARQAALGKPENNQELMFVSVIASVILSGQR